MRRDFEMGLEDREQSAILDLSHRNRPLMIAFGGLKGNMGVAPFEFFKLTKSMKVNKIYLRDIDQELYHSGFPGVSGSIEETVSYLKQKIDVCGARRVVVFGNSMGAYAALLFGVLIGADAVHAFAPNTFVCDKGSDDNETHRLGNEITRRIREKYSARYFDLKDVIQLHGNACELNLYFDSGHETDVEHAMHLNGLPNVVLHAFSDGSHHLIKALKRSGELRRIIISSLEDTSEMRRYPGIVRARRIFAKLFDAGFGSGAR